MKNPFQLNRGTKAAVVAVVIVALATVLVKFGPGQPARAHALHGQGSASNAPPSETSVDLAPSQLNAIEIEPVGTYLFPVEKEAVGTIEFDNNHSVQVFPPYQGKILETFSELGDEVRQGQPLYSIDSPDLIQAESALIGAAATFELTSKELARARDLHTTDVGVSQREVEQAISDEQTAEGALKAARDAVRVFGKSEAAIDQIVATRKIDPALVVASPMVGQITARNAQRGLLAQPGNTPAPYSVADVSRKWMVANVPESDSPLLHVDQPVEVRVMAYPGRVFQGKVSRIYAAVDANTHRVAIRSEIADPSNELRPGMLANFVIRVQAPVAATAVPVNAVVRESDGTMTTWVTTDRRRFSQKMVKLGLQKDGRYQVLEGVERGELLVANGAIFLSNMLQAPPTQ